MNTAVVLVAHAAATFYLTGVIWVVQAVHYPLFGFASGDRSAAFAAAHGRAITPVVGPAMLVELVTAIWLLVERPRALRVGPLVLGVALVAVIWLSTAFVQVPLHGVLARGFDPAAHASLVATNWIRTAAWTLRSALVAVLLVRALQS